MAIVRLVIARSALGNHFDKIAGSVRSLNDRPFCFSNFFIIIKNVKAARDKKLLATGSCSPLSACCLSKRIPGCGELSWWHSIVHGE